MSRAHVRLVLQNPDGSVLTGATVRVLDPATADLLTDALYQADTGSSVLSNPFVSDSGRVDFYLDEPQRIRLGYTAPGGSETYIVTDAYPPAAEVARAVNGLRILGTASLGSTLLGSADGSAHFGPLVGGVTPEVVSAAAPGTGLAADVVHDFTDVTGWTDDGQPQDSITFNGDGTFTFNVDGLYLVYAALEVSGWTSGDSALLVMRPGESHPFSAHGQPVTFPDLSGSGFLNVTLMGQHPPWLMAAGDSSGEPSAFFTGDIEALWLYVGAVRLA